MAGSKKGERRGGRAKGTLNKKTVDLLERIAAIGKTPLEFLCTLMNDAGEDIELRFRAAEVAMPYVHSRRPVEVATPPGEGGGIQIIINGSDAHL